MNSAGFLSLAVVTLVFFMNACDGADTMAVGETLTGVQTLTSANGTFQLGFVNINNTGNWYVCISFAQIPDKTIAWVANRENPLKNNSGTLNLTDAGNLVLSYGNSVIWSTNSNRKASSAVLTDAGNLIVSSAANTSEITWESFENPGNTWLPGMKMNATRKLTTWKSPWDPSPGPYSMQMDPTGSNQFVLLWRSSEQYWESGVWNGQIFSEVPEMTQNFIYDFSFVNGTDKYFTYSVKQSSNFLSRFVLSENGNIQVYSFLTTANYWNLFWIQPRDQCQVYALCGGNAFCRADNVQFCNCLEGFDPANSQTWQAQVWSGGCSRRTALDCGNSSTDGFIEVTGDGIPPGYVDSTSENCPQDCLHNCSCTAYAELTGGICRRWFSDLLNLKNATGGNSENLFVRVAAADLPENGSKKTKVAAAGGAAGVVALIAAGIVILCLFCRRRRKSLHSSEYAAGSLTVFSYRELQIATKNFNERLGGGGFGSVFKGTLPDKSLVAVKKLEALNQGEKQFRMEVSTIGNIQHVNLVRLRGFCSEGSSRLLVYDFMPNSSLNSVLFPKDGNESPPLDWATRYRIALGTARGILYLHEKCRDCIIHCDIKPENILLDADFCSKVADFGLAKLVGREFSHVLTTMRGTRGYLAPEWISGLPITTKADVYSYGMTLIEIISGRRNMDGQMESNQLFFPTWAATQINVGNSIALLDKRLNGDADEEQLKRAAMVGGWCIQDDEDLRPSMSQVVQVLEGIGDIAVPPVPLSLQALVAKNNSLVFYWDKDSSSNANTSSAAGSNPWNSSKNSENSSVSVVSQDNSDHMPLNPVSE